MIARALRRLPWAALLPWLVLAGGLTATYVLRQQAVGIEQQDLRAHFQDQVENIAGRIEQRSRAYEKILRGAALFVEDAGPGALGRYWDGLKLEQSFPGVQSLAVAWIVPARDKGQLEALRRHGYPRLVVRPEGERGLYAPIVAIEPQSSRNLNVLGYDPYAEAVRREAMESSRDSNRRALSGKVKLFDEPIAGPQAGAVMWVPVFRRGAARQTVAERHANIVGWVSFTLRVGNFVGSMLSAQDAGIALELYDGERASADALLHTAGPAESGKGRAPLFAATKRIEIGGRAWTVNARSLPAFEAGVDHTRAELVQWTGSALSLLLALLAWLLLGLRDQARALARELTRELRESEVRWKFAIEGSGDGLWDWSVADGRTYYSPRWKSIMGYADDEIGDDVDENRSRVHPEDRAAVEQLLRAALRGDSQTVQAEFRVRCKDGSWKWVLDRGIVVGRTKAGRAERMIGTRSDMTVRRREEDRLRNFERMVEHSPVAKLITDTSGRIKYMNQAFETMTGYTRDEVIGRKPSLLKSDLTPPATYENLWASIKAGRTWNGELQNRRKNGELYWESQIIAPVENARGEIASFVAVKEDITERKRMEQALREDAAFKQVVLDSAPAQVVVLDAAGVIVALNERWRCAAVENSGVADEMAKNTGIGANYLDAVSGDTSESAQQVYAGILAVLERRAPTFRLEYPCDGPGGRCWYAMNVMPMKSDQGGVVITHLDITERKRVEAELREKEARHRVLLDSASDGIITCDVHMHIVGWNKAAERIFGYVPDEAIGRNVAMLMPPDLRAGYLDELLLKDEGGERYRYISGKNIERLARRKDGSEFFVEFSVADWKAGDERQFTGIVRDITERKNAEQEFLRNVSDLWLREEALGQISQGVVITGADQLTTYVNAAFEDITGYSLKEMLGKPCTLLEGPDTQPEMIARMRAALDTGQPFHGEMLNRRKDGTPFWNELSISPVFDPRGRLSQFIGVLRDITQRKHSEAALLEYSQHLGQMVAERTAQLRALTLELMASEARERRVIAADLHDGLGQSLAVAKLKLTSLVHPEGGESKDDFLRQLKELEDTIDRSNATVRSLSTQLSPPVLYQFGLGAALEWLTEEMMRTYGLSVELSLGGLPQLDETVSSALFRVVRELLINVWKHAEVSKSEVSVSADAAGGEVSIVVADAGVGFDVEHMLKPSANNSYGLFSIRERVAFLGGTMRIDSKPGGGTRVMVGLVLGSKVQTMIEGERK